MSSPYKPFSPDLTNYGLNRPNVGPGLAAKYGTDFTRSAMKRIMSMSGGGRQQATPNMIESGDPNQPVPLQNISPSPRVFSGSTPMATTGRPISPNNRRMGSSLSEKLRTGSMGSILADPRINDLVFRPGMNTTPRTMEFKPGRDDAEMEFLNDNISPSSVNNVQMSPSGSPFIEKARAASGMILNRLGAGPGMGYEPEVEPIAGSPSPSDPKIDPSARIELGPRMTEDQSLRGGDFIDLQPGLESRELFERTGTPMTWNKPGVPSAARSKWTPNLDAPNGVQPMLDEAADNQRRISFNKAAFETAPPESGDLADYEWKKKGFWGKFKEGALGALRGFATGGAPGLLAGAVSGGLGDAFKARRRADLAARDASTRQRNIDMAAAMDREEQRRAKQREIDISQGRLDIDRGQLEETRNMNRAKLPGEQASTRKAIAEAAEKEYAISPEGRAEADRRRREGLIGSALGQGLTPPEGATQGTFWNNWQPKGEETKYREDVFGNIYYIDKQGKEVYTGGKVKTDPSRGRTSVNVNVPDTGKTIQEILGREGAIKDAALSSVLRNLTPEEVDDVMEHGIERVPSVLQKVSEAQYNQRQKKFEFAYPQQFNIFDKRRSEFKKANQARRGVLKF